MADAAPGGKSKACWYPFKKAYERGRIQPNQHNQHGQHGQHQQAYEDPPNMYYLTTNSGSQNHDDSRLSSRQRRRRRRRPKYPQQQQQHQQQKVGVAVFEYDGRDTESQQAGETELVLEGHPSPLDLLDLPPALLEEVDQNSLISEDEWLRQKQRRQRLGSDLEDSDAGLAGINANCMSKEFWVDEIVEGGSLACVEEFLPTSATRRRGSLDRDSSLGGDGSIYSHSSSAHSYGSKNVRFSSAYSDTGTTSSLPGGDSSTLPGAATTSVSSHPRIEIEYDFVTRDQQLRQTKQQRQQQQQQQQGQQQTGMTCGQMTGCASTSMPPKSRTTEEETLNTTATSDSPNERPRPSRPPPTVKLASLSSPPQQKARGSMAKKVMCVARPFRKRNKEKNKNKNKTTTTTTTPPIVETKQEEPMKDHDDPAIVTTSREDSPPDISGELTWLQNTATLGHNALALGNTLWTTSSEGCTNPLLMKSKPRLPPQSFYEDAPDNPHFFVEIQATPKQLQGVKNLEDFSVREEPPQRQNQQQQPPMLLPKEMALARSSSLVDEDSAFMDGPCSPSIGKRFTSSTPTRTRSKNSRPTTPKLKAKEKTTTPSKANSTKNEELFDEYRRRWPDQPLDPPPSNTIVGEQLQDNDDIVRSPQRTRSSKSKTPLEPQVVPYSPGELDELAAAVPDSRLEDPDVMYSREVLRRHSPPTTTPEGQGPRGSRDAPRHTQTRSSSGGIGIGTGGEELMDTSYDTSTSPWRNKVANKRRERAKSLAQATMHNLNGHHHNPHVVEDDGDDEDGADDMTTEIGEGFGPNQDFPHTRSEDYELARFPSLATEDWNPAGIGESGMPRTGGQNAADYDAAWIHSRDAQKHAALNGNGETWDEVHGIQRTPSLDESFDNALPYVDGENTADERDQSFISQELQVRSGKNIIKSPRRSAAPFSSWADNEDDEDSGLNTEAFQKLTSENDEDSIFQDLTLTSSIRSGLRAHRGRSYRAPPPEATKQRLFTEESSRGSLSSDSEDQSRTARSRYTSRTPGDASRGDLSFYSKFSKYSKGELTEYTDAYSTTEDQSRTARSRYTARTLGDASRGDLSFYSKFSKYSRFSRGDMTEYTDAYSTLDEQWNCMDPWL